MKKIKLGLLVSVLAVAGLLSFGRLAKAATPLLTLSNSDGDNVQITVTGDPNSGVLLSYQKSGGGLYLQSLGTTNANGNLTTTISTGSYGILPSSSVNVIVNTQQSAAATWPYSSITGAGAIALTKTGLVMTVGQSATINVNNSGSNVLYLLSNSNPQIANINISNSQVSVQANTYGQTVFTVCVLGTTSNCASAYITVQNSGAQALTFSQNSLTIAYNQNTTVSILNGTTNNTGNYSILNNSNPSTIAASISNSTLTLTANNNSGTASITICSTDMSSCGIISASAGSVTSAGLTFSQSAPTMLIGQTLNIVISGGTNCNISSNSNSSVVQASINTNTNSLVLTANNTGSSIITVCSSSGNCNSLTATVGHSSTGGPITLSQSNLWLQVGQSVSVTVSGGNMPYSILNNSSNFQASLSNNIVTLTGVAAGSSAMNVCSSGGACISLSVLVNGVSTSNQLTFSNNNLTLSVGNSTTVSLFGAGGYYISNSNNQNVASFTLNNDKVSVTGVAAGSASATVCQTGGQCSVIYASVTSPDNSTLTPPAFSPNNPTIGIGQSVNITISGGTSSNYFISSNSNTTIVQTNLSGQTLNLIGQNNGSAVIIVCAATNSCSSLAVTVNPAALDNTNNGNNTGTSTPPVSSDVDDITKQINSEATTLYSGNLTNILKSIKVTKNAKLEASDKTKYLATLLKGLKLTTTQANSLNYFVTYGTPSTLKIGTAERANILASYLWTYKKLPNKETEWSDLFNIVFNRLPLLRSQSAETQAKEEFKKVYSRNANLNNSADKAAVMIMAYGLRSTSRNLTAENKALKLFKTTYSHAPVSPLAWNIVRAIAYSGVTK
jgi:hypothetical protein